MHEQSDCDSAEQSDCDNRHDVLVENDIVGSGQQKDFTVLEEKDIRARQEEDIETLCAILSIPRAISSILLHHYHWNVNDVHEKWFADENYVRKAVGMLEAPIAEIINSKEVTCEICFESFPVDQCRSTSCGHLFCQTCWKDYVKVSIDYGPGCLKLRCPHPSCIAVVDQDMINSLASIEDKEKYARFLFLSYVDNNRKIKWCPAPGCKYAVEFAIGSGKSCNVTCLCSYEFCWNCTQEVHPAVDCNTVANWFSRYNLEFNMVKWKTPKIKPCPMCDSPVEKRHGSLRMICASPCRYHFCWICLEKWWGHEDRYGFSACNCYIGEKQVDANDSEVYFCNFVEKEFTKRNMTPDRYMHYYCHWESNDQSREKALSKLSEMQTVTIKELTVKQSQPEWQLQFIIEAWQKIIECRSILKWSYAYGFFIPEHEHAKRQFLEFLQGEAEAHLTRLHDCLDYELLSFLRAEGPLPEFNDFRCKIVGLTSITGNYFKNLLKGLENNLSDDDSKGL